MSTVTIAVLADVHLGDALTDCNRRCEIADVLLKRAVLRLNRLIKPDVTLVLGDLINDDRAARTEDDLRTLRVICDELDSPYLAVPGNHDGDVERFYRVFDRPDDMVDIAGVRFLPFVDTYEPRYCASRAPHDIARMREARSGYKGPIVALQHVCLWPPGDVSVAPYNYTNAADIVDVMRETGVALSVSGHHHRGCDDVQVDGMTFVNVPGLCEPPFQFAVIRMDDDGIESERHELVMPSKLALQDNHIHTQLAYCAENMDVARTISLARDFGLGGITFCEHAGQLYYERKAYWANAWLEQGVQGRDVDTCRMAEYLALKSEFEDDYAQFGLEVECDARGTLVVEASHRAEASLVLGSVHGLSGVAKGVPLQEGDSDLFLAMVEAMCKQGIAVLAHPLRIFRRLGHETPAVLFEKTAELLRRYGVAAELNFHSNEPPEEFVRACLARGVKFSFGSDAHNLAEIGEFACQLELLERAGFNGDLNDILWRTAAGA